MWAAVAQEDFFHGAVRENKNQHLDFLWCGAEEGQSGYRSLSGPTVWQLHALSVRTRLWTPHGRTGSRRVFCGRYLMITKSRETSNPPREQTHGRKRKFGRRRISSVPTFLSFLFRAENSPSSLYSHFLLFADAHVEKVKCLVLAWVSSVLFTSHDWPAVFTLIARHLILLCWKQASPLSYDRCIREVLQNLKLGKVVGRWKHLKMWVPCCIFHVSLIYVFFVLYCCRCSIKNAKIFFFLPFKLKVDTACQ